MIVGRAITLKREPSKKKQKFYTIKDSKTIKGDNFTRSNKEKYDWMAPYLFHILVVTIIFSQTVYSAEIILNLMTKY